MNASNGDKPDVALIGAGRLARAFIPALHAAGYPIVAIADKVISRARRACRMAPGAAPKRDAESAVAPAALILLAVPDAAIAPLAARLAARADLRWRGKIVLHHAGALGPDQLAPLARRGAAVGLLHPLQSLGDGPLAAALLRGSSARIEGGARAGAAARRLARDLGLVPLRFGAALSAEQRTIYHAAAALLSNDLMALLGIGSGLLRTLGLSQRAAIAALAPLARGSLLQAERQGLGAALTGPVARGDVETLAAHLRSLKRRSGAAERLHRLLSEQLLLLAEGLGEGPARDSRRRMRSLLRSDRTGRRRPMKL